MDSNENNVVTANTIMIVGVAWMLLSGTIIISEALLSLLLLPNQIVGKPDGFIVSVGCTGFLVLTVGFVFAVWFNSLTPPEDNYDEDEDDDFI